MSSFSSKKKKQREDVLYHRLDLPLKQSTRSFWIIGMVFYAIRCIRWERNPSLFIIPLVVCIVTMLLFIIYLQVFSATGGQRGKGFYCEIPSKGLFIEPINTWSNLGFILIGLFIAWQMVRGTFHSNVNNLTQSDSMSIFFSSLVVFLGPASMVMHATYTTEGGELDVLSEYLICAFLIAYSTQRLFRQKIVYFFIVFFVIILICELVSRWNIYLPVIGGPANLLVAIFVILFIIAEVLIVYVRHSNIHKRWAFASAVTFIGAFLIWNFSNTGGPLCFPTSWFQGHAVWHLLVAVALYLLFRYHISENNTEHSDFSSNIF